MVATWRKKSKTETKINKYLLQLDMAGSNSVFLLMVSGQIETAEVSIQARYYKIVLVVKHSNLGFKVTSCDRNFIFKFQMFHVETRSERKS